MACKRKSFTVKEKLEIVRRLESGEKNSQIARDFGVSHSTISTIYKNKNQTLASLDTNSLNIRRMRGSFNNQLDQVLLSWFKQQQSLNMPLNGAVMQAKANEFASKLGLGEHLITSSWIQRFRTRNNVQFNKPSSSTTTTSTTRKNKDKATNNNNNQKSNPHSFANAAHQHAHQNLNQQQNQHQHHPHQHQHHNQRSISESWLVDTWPLMCSAYSPVAESWLLGTWPLLCSVYAPDNIFYAKEFGLFYNVNPFEAYKFKSVKCTNGEWSNERLTIMVATNVTGTIKRPLLVIGKSKKPNHCSLPSSVQYESHAKAWMTTMAFEKWLHEWDRSLAKQERKICLILDSCQVHPYIEGLQCINIQFLPSKNEPTTTAATTTMMMMVLCPLEHGIMKSLKTMYRKLQVTRILQKISESETETGLQSHTDSSPSPSSSSSLPINIFDALLMLSEAWNTVTALTILRSFRLAGFMCQSALSSSLSSSSSIDDESKNNNNDDEDADKSLGNLTTLGILLQQLSKYATNNQIALEDDFIHIDDNVQVCEVFNNNNEQKHQHLQQHSHPHHQQQHQHTQQHHHHNNNNHNQHHHLLQQTSSSSQYHQHHQLHQQQQQQHHHHHNPDEHEHHDSVENNTRFETPPTISEACKAIDTLQKFICMNDNFKTANICDAISTLRLKLNTELMSSKCKKIHAKIH